LGKQTLEGEKRREKNKTGSLVGRKKVIIGVFMLVGRSGRKRESSGSRLSKVEVLEVSIATARPRRPFED